VNFLTVTELTRYLKELIKADPILDDVWVKGEVSNFKEYKMGKQLYFTLKDNEAQISCVMFQTSVLNFKLEENMQILARGKVAVYDKRGTYSLHIKYLEPSGIGALAIAFEQLKRKLEAEGLFQSEYKKAIPKFPKKVAILSSPSGAALFDVISTIRSRNRAVEIVIVPTVVQGDKAGDSIAKNIKITDEFCGAEVMILARGGGSIEELWGFNEEVVARAIFACKTPIISAVGHEVDYTISDFVADARAATPTAAGVMVSLPREEYLQNFINLKSRFKQLLLNKVQDKQMDLAELNFSLEQRIKDVFVFKKQQVELLSAKLKALDPSAYSKRGFAIVRKAGKIVSSASQLSLGDKVVLSYLDGSREAQII
jgi:exodeoxyribonuclease VII large subunit